MAGTKFYGVWKDMRRRCINFKNIAYSNYGGRGIRVCGGWQNFLNFKEDMYSTYKEGLTIERIDNNGHYEPNNCRWATRKDQCNNTRKNYFIEYKGIRDTLVNWANYFKIHQTTLYCRLEWFNWNIEKAFFTPAIKGRNQYGS